LLKFFKIANLNSSQGLLGQPEWGR